jgi:superfamily I DNA and/or RNA helicase
MLREDNLSKTERKSVLAALQALKSGEMKQREHKLRQVRVVGVTCAACTFPVLEDIKFPIVFLDEASQMLEPMSIIPLTRFSCMRLLAVGDPLQLPPTLQSFVEESEDGILKTLFVRLAAIGFEPILLRTQYRVTRYHNL